MRRHGVEVDASLTTQPERLRLGACRWSRTRKYSGVHVVAGVCRSRKVPELFAGPDVHLDRPLDRLIEGGSAMSATLRNHGAFAGGVGQGALDGGMHVAYRLGRQATARCRCDGRR